MPRYDALEVATKADVAAHKLDIGELRDELAGVNQRLDRLFLTLVAGLFAIIAVMAGVSLAIG